MSATKTHKPTEYVRLSCRLDARVKQRVEDAAALLGQSITDFTEAALTEKAQAVFERQERITLSERDFARFVELIEKPATPTQELRDAMRDYKASRSQHPKANL